MLSTEPDEDEDEDEEKEEIKMWKVASWNRPGREASTQFIDIAELGREAGQDPKKAITFGGMDYGLRVLATTVPLTMEQAKLHFNLYSQKLDDGQAPVSVPAEMLKRPRAMKIKAGYLEEKTFSRKFRRKREKWRKYGVGGHRIL